MKRLICMLLLLATGMSGMSCQANSKIDNTPIKSFELSRFLGKWYEIARYDHKFEKEMDFVTAEYSLREDGKVEVINSGMRKDVLKVAEGKAIQPDSTSNPAHLRVSFFWFFYSDYNILLLDEGYNYALIGSKSSKYLWILARTPQISQEVKDILLAEAEKRGYDTQSLIWVRQEKNAR